MKRGVFVLVLAGAVQAKPMSIAADRELRSAWLVAEVELLDARQRGPRQWVVKVRVTKNPRRIFHGFAQLGKTLELRPAQWGAGSFSHQLSAWRKNKRARILLAAKAGGEIRLGGTWVDNKYHLQGWFDFNACWLYCVDKTFGQSLQGRRILAVPPQSIHKLHRTERERFWGRVARFLVAEPAPLGAPALDALIKRLNAPDRAARLAAQQELVGKGALAVAALRSREQAQKDPEARRRLQAVLAALETYETAQRIATRIAESDVTWVLQQGLPALEGASAARVRTRLEQLRSSGSKDARTPR